MRVVIAFLLSEIQTLIVIKSWGESIVEIRNSEPVHSYFPIECNVTPLVKLIWSSILFVEWNKYISI